MEISVDADSLIYKAALSAEYTVYDIYPLSFKNTIETEDNTDPADLLEHRIKHFRYAAEYVDWLKEVGKTGDDFYRHARTELQPLSYAINILKGFMTSLVKRFDPEQMTVYLTAGRGFRYKAARFAGYKANRIGRPKPLYFNQCNDYLIEHWGAKVHTYYEADDAVAIALAASNLTDDPCILVSIDKDLDTVPGLHYNIDKKLLYSVSQHDALVKFYTQLLTGDTSDNIKGVRGWSEKNKAKLQKFFAPLKTEEDMYDAVLAEYYAQYGCIKVGKKIHVNKDGMSIAYVLLRENADLLYIQQADGDAWLPPGERV